MRNGSNGRMRVVLDTNTVLSGSLWDGIPNQLLNLGREGAIRLFTSKALLKELDEVLPRDKFTAKLASKRTTPALATRKYEEVTKLVTPKPIERTVRDIDDDVVIGTALAAQADLIVSGDKGLLALHPHQGIPILNARAALQHVEARLREQSGTTRKDIREELPYGVSWVIVGGVDGRFSQPHSVF